MHRISFEGFSVVPPQGWSDILEDETYSDPGELPPVAFGGHAGTGKLYISVPSLRADEDPGTSPEDALARALDWGARRGASPIEQANDSSPVGALGYAAFEIAGSYVAVWFLLGGDAILHASYVCEASQAEVERDAREALIASLAFSS